MAKIVEEAKKRAGSGLLRSANPDEHRHSEAGGSYRHVFVVLPEMAGKAVISAENNELPRSVSCG